jgi:hypothetical protein
LANFDNVALDSFDDPMKQVSPVLLNDMPAFVNEVLGIAFVILMAISALGQVVLLMLAQLDLVVFRSHDPGYHHLPIHHAPWARFPHHLIAPNIAATLAGLNGLLWSAAS